MAAPLYHDVESFSTLHPLPPPERDYELWAYSFKEHRWIPRPIDDETPYWLLTLIKYCQLEQIKLLECQRGKYRYQIHRKRCPAATLHQPDEGDEE